MMPSQQEIELPLLRALHGLGGTAEAYAVYKAVTSAFPQLTADDAAEQNMTGGNKWTNRIQWTRQRLLAKGEMESAGWGVWAITPKGILRLNNANAGAPGNSSPASPGAGQLNAAEATPPVHNFEETVDEYTIAFKDKILQKLRDLKPDQFEVFAGILLKAFGFHNITITARPGDGGIDGYGELKVGLASLKAAFQCKRWQNQVGAKEVREFRGAIQGEFEQGYFFATSTFSTPAQSESLKRGAAPVILFDGSQIVTIMIEKGIGIIRRPVEVYEDNIDGLFANSK